MKLREGSQIKLTISMLFTLFFMLQMLILLLPFHVKCKLSIKKECLILNETIIDSCKINETVIALSLEDYVALFNPVKFKVIWKYPIRPCRIVGFYGGRYLAVIDRHGLLYIMDIQAKGPYKAVYFTVVRENITFSPKFPESPYYARYSRSYVSIEKGLGKGGLLLKIAFLDPIVKVFWSLNGSVLYVVQKHYITVVNLKKPHLKPKHIVKFDVGVRNVYANVTGGVFIILFEDGTCKIFRLLGRIINVREKLNIRNIIWVNLTHCLIQSDNKVLLLDLRRGYVRDILSNVRIFRYYDGEKIFLVAFLNDTLSIIRWCSLGLITLFKHKVQNVKDMFLLHNGRIVCVIQRTGKICTFCVLKPVRYTKYVLGNVLYVNFTGEPCDRSMVRSIMAYARVDNLTVIYSSNGSNIIIRVPLLKKSNKVRITFTAPGLIPFSDMFSVEARTGEIMISVLEEVGGVYITARRNVSFTIMTRVWGRPVVSKVFMLRGRSIVWEGIVNGSSTVTLGLMDPGLHKVVMIAESKGYASTARILYINVTKLRIRLEEPHNIKNIRSGNYSIVFRVLEDRRPIPNLPVLIRLDKNIVLRDYTDDKGLCIIPLELKSGRHILEIITVSRDYYNGKLTISFIVKPRVRMIVEGLNFSDTVRRIIKVKVQVLNDTKPLRRGYVLVFIDNLCYGNITLKDGIVQIPLELALGTHIVRILALSDNMTLTETFMVKVHKPKILIIKPSIHSVKPGNLTVTARLVSNGKGIPNVKITLIIDFKTSYINITDSKGYVNFNIPYMSPGKHTMIIKVSDPSIIPSETTFTLIVKPKGIQMVERMIHIVMLVLLTLIVILLGIRITLRRKHI